MSAPDDSGPQSRIDLIRAMDDELQRRGLIADEFLEQRQRRHELADRLGGIIAAETMERIKMLEKLDTMAGEVKEIRADIKEITNILTGDKYRPGYISEQMTLKESMRKLESKVSAREVAENALKESEMKLVNRIGIICGVISGAGVLVSWLVSGG